MLLEVSQYLENYLVPFFEGAEVGEREGSRLEHVLSMVLMVNEKFREGVDPWGAFRTRPVSGNSCLWGAHTCTDPVRGGAEDA
jgi:intron-binding protein aquarius